MHALPRPTAAGVLLPRPSFTSFSPCPVQGKWLGFRCAAAGDRFLQARKRSTPCRLVFFSQNVGTWEQWELGTAGPDPDAADWSSLGVTLRHRRLPQYELAVQLERVGVVSLPPNASVTPRSLLAGEQPASAPAGSAGSVGGADEDLQLERRELQRMSGVLVHVSWRVGVARRGRHGLPTRPVVRSPPLLPLPALIPSIYPPLPVKSILSALQSPPLPRSGCTLLTRRRRLDWPSRRAWRS